MKKLNLKLGSIKELLSKEQMKKVVGGDYGSYLCDDRPCLPGQREYFCIGSACDFGSHLVCAWNLQEAIAIGGDPITGTGCGLEG